MKIKELKFNKNEKSVYMRFLSDKLICGEIKTEISQWDEVDTVVCRKLTPKPKINNSVISR